MVFSFARGRVLLASLVALLVLGLACTPAAAPTATPVKSPPVSTPTAATVVATPTPAAPAARAYTPAPATPAPEKETPWAIKQGRKLPRELQGLKPKYGGRLQDFVPTDPGHLDYNRTSSGYEADTLMRVYSGLIRQDPYSEYLEVLPDLAHSWEIQDSGKTFVFRLRKDVKWHDGKPFTAADVEYTFKRWLERPNGLPAIRASSVRALVDGVKTPDPYTLAVTLKRPAVFFLAAIASDWNKIQPRHIVEPKDLAGDKDFSVKDLVGTGPFKVNKYVRGSVFAADKNPGYYEIDPYFGLPMPYLDGMDTYVIPDYGTVRAAFEAGKLHTIRKAVSRVEAADLKDRLGDRITVIETPEVFPHHLYFNLKEPPWNDVRVRRAVHLALNRQDMITVVQKGAGVIPGWIFPGWLGAPPQGELLAMPGWRSPTEADIAEGKRLLAAAGHAGGIKTEIITRTAVETYVPTMNMVAQQLKTIGISVEERPLESAAGLERLSRQNFHLAIQGTLPDYLDSDGIISLMYLEKAGRNYMKWRNDEVESLYLKQAQELDPLQRAKYIRRITEILEEELPLLPLTSPARGTASWKPVKAAFPAPAQGGFTKHWMWLDQ